MSSPEHDLILYDGVCGLCNGFVQFVIRRDSADRYRFATLQSDLGASLVKAHGGNPKSLSTVYLIEKYGSATEEAHTRGKAALQVLSTLGSGWRVLGFMRVLPAPLLNLGYSVVAKLRYRLFGKHAECPVPSPETRRRFL